MFSKSENKSIPQADPTACDDNIMTVTGEFKVDRYATISYLIASYDYFLAAKAIFKMTVKDDKILGFSLLVTPDLDKSYTISSSTICKNNDGTVNYQKSTLVKPTLGIQEPFYAWCESVALNPCVQGVASLAARANIGLGKHFTIPIEKRVPITPEFLKLYFGCDPVSFAKFLTPLMNPNTSDTATGDKTIFNSQKITICGFGLEKNEIHLSTVKRALTPDESKLLDEANNVAKAKLEVNELAKKNAGVKTHREISAENAAHFESKCDDNKEQKLNSASCGLRR